MLGKLMARVLSGLGRGRFLEKLLTGLSRTRFLTGLGFFLVWVCYGVG